MFHPTQLFAATAVAALLSTAAFTAHASDADLASISQVPVTMAQAIATAEQHVKGRATEAEFEREWNGSAYEVKVVTANSRFKVIVDATNGSVRSVREKLPKYREYIQR
jgi:uncharacterized membrane protein YkoI